MSILDLQALAYEMLNRRLEHAINGVCYVCGCTDDDACTPPCAWADVDLCTSPDCLKLDDTIRARVVT